MTDYCGWKCHLQKGPAKPAKKAKEVEKAKPEEKAPEAPAENGEAKAEEEVSWRDISNISGAHVIADVTLTV